MKKLEEEMIKCGKLLFKRHLVSGWGGNLSCRLGENELLITGRHAPLGFLTTADLVRIDGAGRSLNRDQLAFNDDFDRLLAWSNSRGGEGPARARFGSRVEHE